MATSIKLKHSNTQATIPSTSDLIAGEVALNTVDRKFYVRDGSSAVITLSNHYATDFDVNVVTFKVTVATSTSAHPYHGTGSSNKYKINVDPTECIQRIAQTNKLKTKTKGMFASRMFWTVR